MSIRLSVAVDGRRAQDQPLGGVGRSLVGMLPRLAEHCDLTVLTDASRPAPPIDDVRVVALPRPRGAPEAAWLHGPARGWSRRHQHLLHGTFNAIPFGLRPSTPTAVSIYDLTFEVHAEDFDTPRRRAMRQWFRVNARYAARRAGTVITSSHFSAEQLRRHYGVPPERLVVIPCAVDAQFGPHAVERSPDLSARLGLRGPYVVAVGGAPRRGAEVAVEAWQRL
ncbi:MAG: glycosyltransferase, partial [Acidimicrobiales bacterium]|nr:glycosyltransferase [Acidimicrobiales bacterium]